MREKLIGGLDLVTLSTGKKYLVSKGSIRFKLKTNKTNKLRT
jgi:hypothetical protein